MLLSLRLRLRVSSGCKLRSNTGDVACWDIGDSIGAHEEGSMYVAHMISVRGLIATSTVAPTLSAPRSFENCISLENRLWGKVRKTRSRSQYPDPCYGLSPFVPTLCCTPDKTCQLARSMHLALPLLRDPFLNGHAHRNVCHSCFLTSAQFRHTLLASPVISKLRVPREPETVKASQLPRDPPTHARRSTRTTELGSAVAQVRWLQLPVLY